MSEFDKVIGYTAIKQELLQICDMIKNRKKYAALGAKVPHGILIDGKPGYGKTLLSMCFIKEAGLKVFTVRKTKENFAEEITKVFDKAMENTPCIVFLDDIDKFSNADRYSSNTAEYVAVQSGIDACKNLDVLVIATANKLYYLPDSLYRNGRFDRKYKLCLPNLEDSELIICHYLADKKIADDINRDDVLKLFAKKSCAEIETVLNDAAIRAAYAGRSEMGIEDIKEAYVRSYYSSPDYYVESDEKKNGLIALHEAGHVVAAELLNRGSVSIASICEKRSGDVGGFIRQCKENDDSRDDLLIGLAGMAAVKAFAMEDYAEGCGSDLKSVYLRLEELIRTDGYKGIRGIYYEDIGERFGQPPETYKTYLDQQVKEEMEQLCEDVKEMLVKQKRFVMSVADALIEKHTLLASDVQELVRQYNDEQAQEGVA